MTRHLLDEAGGTGVRLLDPHHFAAPVTSPLVCASNTLAQGTGDADAVSTLDGSGNFLIRVDLAISVDGFGCDGFALWIARYHVADNACGSPVIPTNPHPDKPVIIPSTHGVQVELPPGRRGIGDVGETLVPGGSAPVG